MLPTTNLEKMTWRMISKTTSKHTTPAAIGELEPADRTANGSASITAKRQNQADGDGAPLLEASGTLSGHRRAGPCAAGGAANVGADGCAKQHQRINEEPPLSLLNSDASE